MWPVISAALTLATMFVGVYTGNLTLVYIFAGLTFTAIAVTYTEV